MAVRSWVGATLVGALLLTGCGGGLPTTSTEQIGALRTDPDHRGLVALYTGGACETSSRLALKESPTRIDVQVVVTTSTGPCNASAISRTVSARLSQTVGTRQIVSDDRLLIPFDGARLLVPAGLTLDRTGLRETSGRGAGAWTLIYTAPGPDAVGSRCDPAPGTLTVRVGDTLPPEFSAEVSSIGWARVGVEKATLFRLRQPSWDLGYAWRASSGVVVLDADLRCGNARALTPAELLHVARSLRPA